MDVRSYGLVLERDLGRAAQYVRVVEAAQVAAVSARTTEEALFHVRRLGAPAVVVLELNADSGPELQFLRDLRELVGARAAPVVAIVDSRDVYERTARQMIELNIVSLLTRSQQFNSLVRAIRGIVDAATIGSPAAPRQLPPARDDPYLEWLRAAERLSDHALLDKLSRLSVLDNGVSRAEAERVACDTAAAFRAPLALVWLDRNGRTVFATHPRLPDDALLRNGGGPWAALRNVLAGMPLHAIDAARHRLLARNPLVQEGKVRGFAGSPVRAADGSDAGAICLAAPMPGGIAPSLLEPLAFWALRIGGSLPAAQAATAPAPEPATAGAPSTEAASRAPSLQARAARGVLAALETALMVTDQAGLILYANPQVNALLGLGQRRLRGLRRRAVLAGLRTSTDIPGSKLAELASASLGREPAEVELPFTRPSRTVLRWRTRLVELQEGRVRLDEISDLRGEAADSEHRQTLVRIDALTDLPNRRGGEEALGREVARSLRTSMPLSVALFEVDSLEVFEAKVAEQVFRAMAWLLRDALRAYDLAVRWDLYQLLAIVPGASAAEATAVAQRFRTAVEQTALDGLPRATVSGGVAEFDPEKDVNRLLAESRAALIEARRQGGNAII